MDYKQKIISYLDNANFKKNYIVSNNGFCIEYSSIEQYNNGTDIKYLKKKHKLQINEEVFLILGYTDFKKGDFFVADRTYEYSIVFTKYNLSISRIVKTTGWNDEKDGDYFYEADLNKIEDIEVQVDSIKLNFNDSTEPFSIPVIYFGRNYFDNNSTNLILNLIRFLLKELRIANQNEKEKFESFYTKFKSLLSTGKYHDILDDLNDFSHCSHFLYYKEVNPHCNL